jgi:chromosome partitioning protein
MIIDISHQKGGVGKSTIAFNLAIALGNSFKIEVIDLDVQNTITHTNKIRKENGFKKLKIKYINNEKELKEYIELDNNEKITIIDSGGFDSSLNRLAIFYSDMVITPVSDRFNEISGLMKYIEILQELNKITGEDIKVNVLLNNINPKVKNFDGLKTFIKKNREFKLLDTILRQRADYDKAAWKGQSVKEYNKESKASAEFTALVKEIKKKLGIKNGKKN